MQTDRLIALNDFCRYHNIEVSFVQSLTEFGLINTIKTGENLFVEPETLPDLEKMLLLHYDLDVNLEGIETIIAMLQRINQLNQQMTELQNRLRFYEGDAS
jgi:hypothetical protein